MGKSSQVSHCVQPAAPAASATANNARWKRNIAGILSVGWMVASSWGPSPVRGSRLVLGQRHCGAGPGLVISSAAPRPDNETKPAEVTSTPSDSLSCRRRLRMAIDAPPSGEPATQRVVLFFGGNGHAAVRLEAATSALARRVRTLELDAVPYPGFEGRPPAGTLEAFLDGT